MVGSRTHVGGRPLHSRAAEKLPNSPTMGTGECYYHVGTLLTLTLVSLLVNDAPVNVYVCVYVNVCVCVYVCVAGRKWISSLFAHR